MRCVCPSRRSKDSLDRDWRTKGSSLALGILVRNTGKPSQSPCRCPSSRVQPNSRQIPEPKSARSRVLHREAKHQGAGFERSPSHSPQFRSKIENWCLSMKKVLKLWPSTARVQSECTRGNQSSWINSQKKGVKKASRVISNLTLKASKDTHWGFQERLKRTLARIGLSIEHCTCAN